jgi:hypothetical protein
MIGFESGMYTRGWTGAGGERKLRRAKPKFDQLAEQRVGVRITGNVVTYKGFFLAMHS